MRGLHHVEESFRVYVRVKKRDFFGVCRGGHPSGETGSAALLPGDWPTRDPWPWTACCHCWRMMDVVSRRRDGGQGAQSERGRRPVILCFPPIQSQPVGRAEPKSDQVFFCPMFRCSAQRLAPPSQLVSCSTRTYS